MGSVDCAGLWRGAVRGWRAAWVVGALALALGACIIEPQDEGGGGDGSGSGGSGDGSGSGSGGMSDPWHLISGSPVAGTLAAGEIDTFWFEAKMGHSVVVRIVDPFDGELRRGCRSFGPMVAPRCCSGARTLQRDGSQCLRPASIESSSTTTFAPRQRSQTISYISRWPMAPSARG